MEEQTELYLNLLRHSPNAIFVIDARHNVIIWNKACEVMTGVRESEVLGTSDQWRP